MPSSEYSSTNQVFAFYMSHFVSSRLTKSGFNQDFMSFLILLCLCVYSLGHVPSCESNYLDTWSCHLIMSFFNIINLSRMTKYKIFPGYPVSSYRLCDSKNPQGCYIWKPAWCQLQCGTIYKVGFWGDNKSLYKVQGFLTAKYYRLWLLSSYQLLKYA